MIKLCLTDFISSQSFAAKEKKTSDTEELHFQREVDLGCNGSDFNGDIPNHNTDFQLVPKDGARRKHHRAWTLCEVLKLVEGVARYGAGRWSEIRRVAFASYPYRTSVDLKVYSSLFFSFFFAVGTSSLVFHYNPLSHQNVSFHHSNMKV